MFSLPKNEPVFSVDIEEVRFNRGLLMAQIRELGFDIQQTARADVLVEEALKTSAIEGEILYPDAGPNGFEGGLKNKKYMGIAHTSRATAQRELSDLVQKGVLVRLPGGGRSTGYDIEWDKFVKGPAGKMSV